VNALAKSSEPAAEPTAELAEILSIAAHELRTPATVILGLVSTLAASRARMPEDQAETFGGLVGHRHETLSGARFDVTLRAGSSEPESRESGGGASASRAPVTVLIVDDEPDMLYLLRLTLETAGYEVQEAAHGAEALDTIRASRPDLVVTDLMMPVMDGRELIRRMRESPGTADIPIMVLSANPGNISGADVVMHKPFHPRDLTRTIDEIVGGSS
jgi:CheY-like chemotaxis protein